MEGNKHILVVCQHFWPESFRVNDLCSYFVKQGYVVDVLCGIPNYPKGKFYPGYSFFRRLRENYNGINIYRAWEIPRGNNSNFRIFLNYISFPFFSCFLLPLLLTKKYDRILIYQLSPVYMAIAGILLSKIKKVKTTIYVLDLWPENLFSVLKIKNKLLRKIVTSTSHWCYRNVNKVIVLSEKMKSKLIKIRKGKTADIIILPQPCEKIYETPVFDSELAKRFENKFNLVFTGNISPAQSFTTMINAAKILTRKGIKDINWIIVGDGMSKNMVMDEVNKAGLSNYFYFEGLKPVSEIPKYSYIADAFVACLVKSELLEATIPAKIYSYIAAGKPIVLAMDGEVNNLINSKIRCGYAGPAGDFKTLASNIERLYKTDPFTRKVMGGRAKNFHLKHYERDLIYSKLISFMFD